MKIFSGSSNPSLAQALCDTSQLEPGETHLDNFPNAELKVRVGQASTKAILLQSFSQPVNTHIIEYLLLCDALKRQGVEELISIIPWFGYSKQDKVFQPGEPLSAKVVAKLIQTTHTRKLITIDLHNPSITGYFDIPVTNLTAFPIFMEHITTQATSQDACVISPDAGAIKSTTKVAHELNLPIAFMNKSRDLTSGEVTIQGIDRDISGKQCLIFDDLIATGSTIVEVSQFLRDKGAKSIHVYATHHLFIPGVQDKLEASPITAIHVTDTVSKPDRVSSSKLTIHSVAPLIAQALTG